MQGKIIKGIAGFYYVHVPGFGLYECKAKGLFRKEQNKPLIGDDVMIGPNATFTNDLFPRSKQPFELKRTYVKQGATIGANATILAGVEIGEGAIIAAGALILSGTKVPPYTMWAGVPAKFMKKVDPSQTNEINRKIAHNYSFYASWYQEDNDSKKSE